MNPLLPIEWIVAVRFLREGRIQTLFIITGTAIGVAVIVFMSALLSGLQANLFERVLSTQAHIVLERQRDMPRPQLGPAPGTTVLPTVQIPVQRVVGIDQWQRIRADLRLRRDIEVVAPVVAGPAFIVRGETNQAISLIGIEPEVYRQIVPLPDKLMAGQYRLTTSDMLIGTQLAEDLGARVGDKLRVSGPQGVAQTLTVAGLVDLGSRAANERTVYALLPTAQSLVNLIGSVSRLEVTVAEPFAAEGVARALARDTGLRALSWVESNQQFFIAINAQNMSSRLIRFFIALSVAAGITSVLVVSVVQRSREIGILRAIGGSRGQVLRVFLFQGGIVGLLGSVLGSGFAALLVLVWRVAARNPDGSMMFDVNVDMPLVLVASAIATVTGLVAAVTPALRAARLEPVEAIRA